MIARASVVRWDERFSERLTKQDSAAGLTLVLEEPNAYTWHVEVDGQDHISHSVFSSAYTWAEVRRTFIDSPYPMRIRRDAVEIWAACGATLPEEWPVTGRLYDDPEVRP